jgi:hypothetical protein
MMKDMIEQVQHSNKEKVVQAEIRIECEISHYFA